MSCSYTTLCLSNWEKVGRRPQGRPRTRWRDYISRLAWESFVVFLVELMEAAGGSEVWASLLGLLSLRPNYGYMEDNGWMDGWNC